MDYNNLHTTITQTTQELLQKMGFSTESELSENGQTYFVSVMVVSGDSGSLIGKNGGNLDAIEHLIKMMVNRKIPNTKPSLILDINEYRKIKTKELIETAKETAERVAQTTRSEVLRPMTSYERRLVHLELAAYKNIATTSVGDEPKRRVVVKAVRFTQ